MKNVWRFVSGAGGWAMASEFASVIFYALGLVGVSKWGPTITPFVMVAISIPLFWIGAYMSWRKHDREIEVLKSLRPEVYIEPMDIEWNSFSATPLKLRNRGAAVAHDIEIKAADLLPLAYFDKIDILPSESIGVSYPHLATDRPLFNKSLLPLLADKWNASTSQSHFTEKVIIPTVVSYTDKHKKRRFTTEVEIQFWGVRYLRKERVGGEVSGEPILSIRHLRFGEIK